MGSRGRQSSAALSVVRPAGIETIDRLQPLVQLTMEQAEVWRTVVDHEEADWFSPSTGELLAHYCRHVVAARRVAQLIAAAEAGETLDVEEYDRLLKMQEREGRAMSSLATKMRISQQATIDKRRQKPKTSQKPWD